MPVVLDDETTKLHVFNGEVWYAKHEYVPVNSRMSPLEFLSENLLVVGTPKRAFRLLGVPTNAELISSLYVRFNRGDVRSVYVAGPNAVAPGDWDTYPENIFVHMRNCYLPPACGGWHQVSLFDYPTYALSARLQKNGFFYDDTAATYLKLHPAFCHLSFIPTLDPAVLSQLLVAIIDPRWYANVRTSELGNKLRLFCGLTPKIQKKITDNSKLIVRRREQLCRLAFKCWHSVPINQVNLNDPQNFLYRIKAQHAEEWRGNLRASQKFLDYLTLTWQHALNQSVTEPLFVPTSFFFSRDEAEAYVTHVNNFKTRQG